MDNYETQGHAIPSLSTNFIFIMAHMLRKTVAIDPAAGQPFPALLIQQKYLEICWLHTK